MANFMHRMIRAAALDAGLYEEVEADTGAMGQAVGIVVLASVAAGIGNITQGGLAGLIIATLAALLGWYVWALLTYVIGTKLLPQTQTRADLGELFRTIGFASTPGLLRALGVIPGLTGIVFIIGGLWMLAAMVVGVRQALDYTSTGRAIGVCVIGWIVQGIILLPMLLLFGLPPETA